MASVSFDLMDFNWETAEAIVRHPGGCMSLRFPYELLSPGSSSPATSAKALATFTSWNTLQPHIHLRHKLFLCGFMGAAMQRLIKKAPMPEGQLFRTLLIEWGQVWVPKQQSARSMMLITALRRLEGYSGSRMAPFIERVARFDPSHLSEAEQIASTPKGRIDLEHDPLLGLIEERGNREGFLDLALDAMFYLRVMGYVSTSEGVDRFNEVYQEARKARNHQRAVESNRSRQPWQKGAGSVKQYVRGSAKS